MLCLPMMGKFLDFLFFLLFHGPFPFPPCHCKLEQVCGHLVVLSVFGVRYPPRLLFEKRRF